jgi:hypothetical protein
MVSAFGTTSTAVAFGSALKLKGNMVTNLSWPKSVIRSRIYQLALYSPKVLLILGEGFSNGWAFSARTPQEPSRNPSTGLALDHNANGHHFGVSMLAAGVEST